MNSNHFTWESIKENYPMTENKIKSEDSIEVAQ